MVATGVVLLAFALRGNAVPLIDIEKHIFVDRHDWVDSADFFCAVACLYPREVCVGEHLRNEEGEAHRALDAVICVIDEVGSVRVPLSNHLCGIETQEVSNIRACTIFCEIKIQFPILPRQPHPCRRKGSARKANEAIKLKTVFSF